MTLGRLVYQINDFLSLGSSKFLDRIYFILWSLTLNLLSIYFARISSVCVSIFFNRIQIGRPKVYPLFTDFYTSCAVHRVYLGLRRAFCFKNFFFASIDSEFYETHQRCNGVILKWYPYFVVVVVCVAFVKCFIVYHFNFLFDFPPTILAFVFVWCLLTIHYHIRRASKTTLFTFAMILFVCHEKIIFVFSVSESKS